MPPRRPPSSHATPLFVSPPSVVPAPFSFTNAATEKKRNEENQKEE